MVRWASSSVHRCQKKVAGLLITTEAMVAEKPEPKGSGPAGGPPGGDMGGAGMGF